MTEAPLLDVENLVTTLRTDQSDIVAVAGVSLKVGRGEAVALVGESGCGKSITALSLMRLLPTVARISPSSSVRLDGVDLTKLKPREMQTRRGHQLAMIFQDPMTFLNPVMRIGDQIIEAIVSHRDLTRQDASSEAVAALERVRIPAPERMLSYFPHQLSGGMRQRVLIAIAIACRPALLIADEPTTALDVTIQAQIMDLLRDIRSEIGSALLLITHDLGLVAEYADRVYVMYAGQIVENASVHQIFNAPQHPYTRALLRSSLSIERRVEHFETIEGIPPNLASPPPGCRFHPRCPERFGPCSTILPDLMALENNRTARCLLHAKARQ
jgi:oligopeptide/dipeptide ABC transporter ATP-binding protein